MKSQLTLGENQITTKHVFFDSMRIKELQKSWNTFKWEKCGQNTQKSVTLILNFNARYSSLVHLRQYISDF